MTNEDNGGNSDAGILRVLATVSSSGEESNGGDNRQWLDIALREFSTVEVVGWASTKAVSLEEVGLSGAVNVTHTMEVRNGGPSAMETAVVEVAVPRRYVDPFMLFEVDVFDWQSSELVVSVLWSGVGDPKGMSNIIIIRIIVWIVHLRESADRCGMGG